jgi:hypothetical protein
MEKLTIVRNDSKEYVVQSAAGTVYGPAARTKEQAEEILKDWENYYAE